MSKIKLLLDVVTDLHSLAESLEAVCKAMTDTEDKHQEIPEPTPSPTITIEDIRTALKKLETEQAKFLINKYGCSKLTDIDPVNYEKMLKEAEVLQNAN